MAIVQVVATHASYRFNEATGGDIGHSPNASLNYSTPANSEIFVKATIGAPLRVKRRHSAI